MKKSRSARLKEDFFYILLGIIITGLFIMAYWFEEDPIAVINEEKCQIKIVECVPEKYESNHIDNQKENIQLQDEKEFTPLDVPMDESIQEEIASICEEQHISFSFVMAVIKKESNFKADSIGDKGNSLGLMQIQPKWHAERMEELGVTNLMDPIENVKIGVNLLIELFETYGDAQQVLMAYNMKRASCLELWEQGIYETAYTREVLATAEEYERYLELK